jgi:Asp-tRNA(Asn)/Glu-tRNA(Gln) amidotransferase A subunit family amidase
METAYMPATELAARIRRGDRSPVEVVEGFLDRIERLDDGINAFVTVREEAAREEAEAAERALSAGEAVGPLHGVPVAVKDLTDVAGVPTTFGSKLFADHVPDEDAVVVERLKDAGAIVLGKTNTPEFGRKPMTTNLLHGTTSNPWDATRTAGGSSGGSAAALAAGLVPLATGSDAAGSLRIPASACGVTSIVPDFGRVPVESRPDGFVNTHPYTYVGPMARSVEDAALLLDVMAGPDGGDPFGLPAGDGSYREATRRGVDGLDVAYSPDLGIAEVDPTVEGVVEEAVGDLERVVATVDRIDGVFEADWRTLDDALETLLQDRYGGMYDEFVRERGIDLLERRGDVTEEVVSRVERALELDALDVRRAERVRTGAYDAMREVLSAYDLLVTPTLGLLPFEKGTKPTEIGGVPIDPLHGWALTWPTNLTGNPAVAVPAGVADGLPVGLQIIGRRLEDGTVVSAAAAYERVRPWTDSYPVD